MKITLIAAISLDGFITRHDESGSGFTSPEDKAFFNRAVREFDCLIFGGRNYRVSADWIRNRLRPEQLKVVLTRDPARHNADAIPGKLEFTSAPVTEIIRQLRSRSLRHVCVLGGGEIYGLFLEAGAVDELWLTLEPRLFGEGVKLVSSRTDIRAELLSAEKLNASTLLLKYRPDDKREADK